MPKTKQNNEGFDIYITTGDNQRRLIDVSNELHRVILENVSERPMSTTEISELTGKAQSTLSVHLDQLVNMGLIMAESDKLDSRRKVFHITSARVGSSKPPSEEGVKEAIGYIDLALDANSEGFYKFLLKSILMSAESNGMDICPMMEMLGASIAKKLIPRCTSTKVEGVIKEIQEFYEKSGLGEVCIYTFLPLTIIIRDPDETQYRFEAFASFSHGLFKTMLSQIVGKEYKILKSEIFGTGNNYYKFIIDLA